MTKSVRLLLGIATLWPLVHMFLFFLFFFGFILSGMVATLAGSTGDPSSPIPTILGFLPIGLFVTFFCLQFFTTFWTWGLLAFYIVDIFKNDRVDKDKKTLWAVVIFLGGVFAMPVYWYLYIWRDPGQASSRPQGAKPT